MAFSIPPSNFNFQLNLEKEDKGQNAAFTEVSGLNVSLEIKEVTEGGLNDNNFHLPVRTKYEELVLSRGFIYQDSDLGKWVSETLEYGIEGKIETRNINLHLMDTSGRSLMTWIFEKAYPVEWKIINFNADKREIIIEKISFRYLFFKRT